jgi:hypothetical protein
MASRTLKLRRPDRCVSCGAGLAAGAEAHWDADARTVTCLACVGGDADTPEELERGTPGASAAREYERRRRNREQRTRAAHPRIGGLLLALRDEPQHQRAWQRGEHGEIAVGESLERRTADSGVVLLHDRRRPGGRGNIDHLAIAPSGVYVIDAKDLKGKVSVSAPLLGKPKLMIAGRDRTTLIDGLDRQVSAVRDALAGTTGPPAVQGVLCFTQADLPLFGTTKMRSHLLLYRKALAKRLNAAGPASAAQIDATARLLAGAFPPA